MKHKFLVIALALTVSGFAQNGRTIRMGDEEVNNEYRGGISAKTVMLVPEDNAPHVLPGIPVERRIRYNPTLQRYEGGIGTTWVPLSGESGGSSNLNAVLQEGNTATDKTLELIGNDGNGNQKSITANNKFTLIDEGTFSGITTTTEFGKGYFSFENRFSPETYSKLRVNIPSLYGLDEMVTLPISINGQRANASGEITISGGGSQDLQETLDNGSEASLTTTDEENKEIFITISKSDTPSGISKESALGFSVQAFNSEATYYDESDYDLRKNAGIAYQALEDRAEAYIITNIGTTKQSISLGGQDASTPNGVRVEDTYANIGLTSGTYFGANATDNTYVQKKKVAEMIAAGGSKFGVQDNLAQEDRIMDMDNNVMEFNHVNEFHIKGGNEEALIPAVGTEVMEWDTVNDRVILHAVDYSQIGSVSPGDQIMIQFVVNGNMALVQPFIVAFGDDGYVYDLTGAAWEYTSYEFVGYFVEASYPYITANIAPGDYFGQELLFIENGSNEIRRAPLSSVVPTLTLNDITSNGNISISDLVVSQEGTDDEEANYTRFFNRGYTTHGGYTGDDKYDVTIGLQNEMASLYPGRHLYFWPASPKRSDPVNTGYIIPITVNGMAADKEGNIEMIIYTAPASPTASGIKGQIAITTTHVYYCVDTNTWVRNAVETTWP